MATGIHDWCSRYLSRLHPEGEQNSASRRSTSVSGGGRSFREVRGIERFKIVLTWISAVLTLGIMPGVVWVTRRLTPIPASSPKVGDIMGAFQKNVPQSGNMPPPPRTFDGPIPLPGYKIPPPPVMSGDPKGGQSPFDTEEGKKKIETIEGALMELAGRMEKGKQKTTIEKFISALSSYRNPPEHGTDEFGNVVFDVVRTVPKKAFQNALQGEGGIFSFVEQQAEGSEEWKNVQNLFNEIDLKKHISSLVLNVVQQEVKESPKSNMEQLKDQLKTEGLDDGVVEEVFSLADACEAYVQNDQLTEKEKLIIESALAKGGILEKLKEIAGNDKLLQRVKNEVEAIAGKAGINLDTESSTESIVVENEVTGALSPFDTKEGKEKIARIETLLTGLAEEIDDPEQKGVVLEFVKALSDYREPDMSIGESGTLDFVRVVPRQAFENALRFDGGVFRFVEEKAKEMPENKWKEVQRLFEDIGLKQHIISLLQQ